MYESNAIGDSYASSLRHSPNKKRQGKSLSVLNQAYYHKANQFKEDNDTNPDAVDLIDGYIHVEKSNSSSANEHNKTKQINIVDLPKDNTHQILKKHSPFNRLMDSEHKYLTRTHSTVDISATLNNKNEVKFFKASLDEIKAKIACITSQIVSNEYKIKEYVSELKEMKKKKEQIKIQLPNKISEKESYEEIYKSNILKYAQSSNKNRKGLHYALKPHLSSACVSGSVIVSKNEILALSIQDFQEAVIAIINDLLINRKYEIVYQNLIVAAISRIYNSLNSTMDLCRGDLFFLKLSKALCDIYPTINKEALTLLLKYSVKLTYIESMISKEMTYLSAEYKFKKNELRNHLNSKTEENSLLEIQLSEMKEKENEYINHLDILADISDKNTMNSSNFFRESVKKSSFLYEDEESEHSFGNKAIDKKCSNNLPQNLFFKKKESERKSDDSNDANNNFSKSTVNNESNMCHKSTSIAGTFLKYDSSFSLMGEDNKINATNNTFKAPIMNNTNSKKHNRNKQLSFDIQRKDNETNQTQNNKIHRYENSPNYVFSTQSQTQQGHSLNCNFRNRRNEDTDKDKSHSFLSLSNNDIGTRYDHYITLLHDTYCYYKFLTKSDPKFNPLLPYSTTPELLGYDKGFISYEQSSESLIFTSCINKKRKHRIKLSSIQGTIVINLIKDIVSIHKSYQNMLQEFTGTSIDVDAFILLKEFNNINLNNNEKIKAALCSFFSFSIALFSNEKIELIFVSYNEFKIWYNSLGYLINNTK